MIRYALFDIIPLTDFQAGYSGKLQHERRRVLEALETNGFFIDQDAIRKWHETNSIRSRVYIIPQMEVDLDTAEGLVAFNDFNRRVIDDGGEGIMIKDPFAPYEGKRTAYWLKKKPVISVTLEVTGVEPGKDDSKYVHTLGALVCHGFDGVEIHTNVGSGIPDDMRDQLWADRDNLIGMLIEIIADKITLEEGSTVYSLRFPRLKGFRGRVPGEKL